MTTASYDATSPGPLARLILGINGLLALFPYWLIALGARAALIRVFWWSARTKAVDGTLIPQSLDAFRLNDTAVYLFSDEYKVHLFGQVYDLPNPTLMASLAMIAEHTFPVLLLLGLGTRYAALGLLGMTVFIETIYPEAYNEHLPWAVCAMVLIKWGGGLFSLDHWIGRGRSRSSTWDRRHPAGS